MSNSSGGTVLNYQGVTVNLGNLTDEQIGHFLGQPVTDQVFTALLKERGRRDNLNRGQSSQPAFEVDVKDWAFR
jgi:hypothetical protein